MRHERRRAHAPQPLFGEIQNAGSFSRGPESVEGRKPEADASERFVKFFH